jgi:hypothetical protein
MKWSVIAVSLAAGASGSLCWSAAALAQEAGAEAGSEAGTTEAGTAAEAGATDSGGAGEASAGACMLDKDCPGGGGNVCGGDVCSWCTTSLPHCKPPTGATSGVMCVPAASGDPGRCMVDTDCKCNSAGAAMSAICCKVGSSFCLPHTCVFHNATFTMPSDGGASSSGSSTDAAAGDDGGGGSGSSSGSSSSGGSSSGGGSSDNGGGGCTVSAAPSSAFGFGAAALAVGLALGLRRRR